MQNLVTSDHQTAVERARAFPTLRMLPLVVAISVAGCASVSSNSGPKENKAIECRCAAGDFCRGSCR